jgi:hypothetical protein
MAFMAVRLKYVRTERENDHRNHQKKPTAEPEDAAIPPSIASARRRHGPLGRALQ